VFSMFGGLLRQSQSSESDSSPATQSLPRPTTTLGESERRSHMRTSSEGATRDDTGSGSPHLHKRSLSTHVSSVANAHLAASTGTTATTTTTAVAPPSFSQPSIAHSRETTATASLHSASQPAVAAVVQGHAHAIPGTPSTDVHSQMQDAEREPEASQQEASSSAQQQQQQQQQSKPGVFSRFASWIVRHKTAEEGYTEMNLGNDSGLYYNDELDMWVMPGGEEVAAKAKQATTAPPSDAMLSGGFPPDPLSSSSSSASSTFGTPPTLTASGPTAGAPSGFVPGLMPGGDAAAAAAGGAAVGGGAPSALASATVQPRSQRSRYVNVFASPAAATTAVPSFSLLPPSSAAGVIPSPGGTGVCAGGAVGIIPMGPLPNVGLPAAPATAQHPTTPPTSAQAPLF
jgi:hypothetical protein